MKNYKNFKTNDFVCDDDFIAWCLSPNEELNAFWNNWMKSHPNQKVVVLEAKQIILDLQSIEAESYESNFEAEIWENIDNIISEKKPIRNLPAIDWVLSSAAVVLILICAVIVFQTGDHATTNFSIADAKWTNFENNSGVAKEIYLPDQSKVVLEPFSILKFPKKFTDEQREVFLKGEAFFDIKRDTTRPFLVYANETITKVLGTSFRITAFEGDEKVEVDVKTGKVAVYAKVAAGKTNEKPMILQADEQIRMPQPNKKIEVTPNQKVIFDRKKEDMIRTVTALPRVIAKLEELPQFKFVDAPVKKVFESIEQAYGIDLEFEPDDLSGCTITTELKDEPLFQKLNIICIALDLKFSERDAVISIEGKPCK